MFQMVLAHIFQFEDNLVEQNAILFVGVNPIDPKIFISGNLGTHAAAWHKDIQL